LAYRRNLFVEKTPTRLKRKVYQTETMHIIIKNMIKIEEAPGSLISYCKKYLAFENPVYKEAQFFGRYTRGINKYIKIFEEDEGSLYLPKGFLPELLSKSAEMGIDVTITDETVKQKEPIDYGSIIKLRDYQEEFVSAILKTKFGGIAVAPPGSGKTVTALEVIARLGMKALWLTHTSDLLRQTTERAEQFLPNAKLGYIGSGKWKEGDITIALVQTLVRRDLTELGEQYPLVIIDECHHTPSSSFTTIVTKLSACLVIGLSATPYRKDGLEDIMFNVVGPTVATVEKKRLIEAGEIIPATVIQRKTGLVINENIADYAKVMEKVYESKPRLDKIVGDVLAEALDENICVVLTRTIAYGKKIFEELSEFGINPSFVYSAEVIKGPGKKKKSVVMPRAVKEENITNFISGKTNVIIATIGFLAEGFDHKPLNRLFLVNPISHKNRTLIEQACGRVERPFPGKEEALVVDYVDGHSMLETQARNRIEIYEDNLMTVKYSNMKTDYLL